MTPCVFIVPCVFMPCVSRVLIVRAVLAREAALDPPTSVDLWVSLTLFDRDGSRLKLASMSIGVVVPAAASEKPPPQAWNIAAPSLNRHTLVGSKMRSPQLLHNAQLTSQRAYYELTVIEPPIIPSGARRPRGQNY